MYKRQRTCVDREKKPFRLPEVLYGKKKFIALGLRDLCDLAAGNGYYRSERILKENLDPSGKIPEGQWKREAARLSEEMKCYNKVVTEVANKI